MNLIREPIDHITVSATPDLIFEKMTTALSRANFKIIQTNNSERLITISCIVDLFNMVLWQAWGDKVLLHFKPQGENETNIQIYGVPNLFRLRVDGKDKVYGKAEIAVELRKIIQNEAAS
jgi:hypothetical protein